MTENQKQQQEKLFEGNPSLKSDFVYGRYSNGDLVITVFWEFEPNLKYNIVLSY